jgi:hypothetical protein
MLASILAHSSRLIFTYVHRGALDGSIAFPEARRWTSSVGSAAEPFIFGFDPEGLPADLEARGFALLSDASSSAASPARPSTASIAVAERRSIL